MLDVRRLRLLRELAARGTVTAVAEALAYTPSAVSQQLSQLEREAGVPLLERVGRGVRLTEAGRRLVSHADAVFARLEAAEADLAGVAGQVAGRLRVAAFQTAAHALVLPALATLGERHPAVRADLLEAEAEEALPSLRLGEQDVVVAEEYDHAPRHRDGTLEREDLGREAILVAVPAGHPLAGRPEIHLADLAGEPWATARLDTAFAQMHARACRSLGGFEPDVHHRTNDLSLLFALVARGHGVALVPGLGHPQAMTGVALAEVGERRLDRRLFTAIRRGTGEQPSLRAFREALAERAVRLGVRM
jgi:DNA-binding transcriptional LysR family regulator